MATSPANPADIQDRASNRGAGDKSTAAGKANPGQASAGEGPADRQQEKSGPEKGGGNK